MGAEKKRILSVDDEPLVGELIAKFLSEKGIETVAVQSAAAALVSLEKTIPDLILLDIRMPEMDGYAFCEILQKNPLWAVVPVIFLTGYNSEENKARAFAAGAVDFLGKPFLREGLESMVIKHLSGTNGWPSLKNSVPDASGAVRDLSFTEFKKSLAIGEEAHARIQDIRSGDLYALAEDLDISRAHVARLAAEFFGIQHLQEMPQERIEIGVLPVVFCRASLVIPFKHENGTLAFAVSNPFNQEVLSILKNRFRETPFILAVLDDESVRAVFQNESIQRRESILEQARMIDENPGEASVDTAALEDENHPVLQIASNMLESAAQKKASDIHIEPKEDHIVIRFRIDGDMQEAFQLKPQSGNRVLSRFKVLAGLDIAQRRKPQDGAFTQMLAGREYKLRVATTSTPQGESMIIRLLEPSARPRKLEELGMTKEQVLSLRQAAGHTTGLILVVGTTGSGKTTTIYSLLFEIDCKTRSLTSVEDPVEYRIPFANQQQVNEKAGVTFESVLKSAMRQDPDTLFLGEVRDLFSAKAALDFASTGHLTITSLHTSNTTTAIFRLERLGVPRGAMADTLLAVVAQKLLKKLCPHCKKIEPPTEEECKMLAPYCRELPEKVARPVGCTKCQGSGYSGREGVYEILNFDPDVVQRIRDGKSISEIRNFVRKRGDYLISHHAVDKVKELLFPPRDVIERVLVEEAAPEEFEESRSAAPAIPAVPVPMKAIATRSGTVEILVAEDDPDIRALVVRLLENRGYRVSSASDGIEALMLLGKQRFDLIISDVEMPNLDGFKLLEMKKQKGVETPVLFLTGRTAEEDEARGLELGATDYIHKPLKKEIFIHRVVRALGEVPPVPEKKT